MTSQVRARISVAAATVLATIAAVALTAWSASASGTPLQDLRASSTENSIRLAWTNPQGEGSAFDGLTIRRSHSATAPKTITSGTEVTNTIGTQKSFTDVGLSISSTYSYSLFARFADGTTETPVTITAYTLPGSTTDVFVKSNGPTSITFSWVNPGGSGFAGTEIVRDDGTTPPTNPSLHYSHQVTVATTDSHATSFTDTGLHIDTRYSYAFFAENKDGRAFAYGITGSTELVAWAGGIVSGDGVDSISCPTTTFCAAVDGNFGATEWNGQAWTSPVQWDNPSGYAGVLTWVSCSSPAFCIAVDDYGNESTWIGGRWQPAQHIDNDSGNGLDGISCVKNEEYCVAIDLDGHAFTFHNGSWSAPSVVDPDASDELFDVSCASDRFCVAYDLKGDDRFTFDGSTWKFARSTLAGRPYITCPNTGFCMGIDADGNTELYDGHGWSVGAKAPLPVHGDVGVQTVSCAWSTHCVAGTSDGRIYTYAGPVTHSGGGWVNEIQPNYEISYEGASCPSSSMCALGGSRPAFNFDGMVFIGRTD